ncbi:MAG: aspartate kinase [Acidobacteria bacterium]|nr:MAG: aspartate kinase [Acidobacteriota bacterium]
MSLGRIVVQKYGGSSVATAEKILAIADRVKTCHETMPHLVVAVSAMGKTTDQLVALARQVSRNPHGRDYDLLLASGEQVAVATLALALHDKGVPAIGLTGAQCNIRTDGSFNRARIQSIDTERIEEELRKGKVVIVAGFQGVTENDEITTLGRGGGDITGAAVAAALNASVCEICTDVDGVLSADPNVVPDARFWPELTYEEAIEMASSGAKVLHPRAAEICMSYKIPIHIRSSFHLREGTWIREGAKTMEEAEVVGVTSDRKIAKVTLLNVPDEPGIAAQIFKDVADRDINIRLIIQSAAADHRAGITFIIEDEFADLAAKLVNDWKQKGLAKEGMVEKDWATIAIIGHRLAATPGLSARMFASLAGAGINVDCISSSEMTMSCIIKRDEIERGVKAVHDEFFASETARKGRTAAAVK